MFKHILIPTDGSELSIAAVDKGIELAKEIGAKVTGLHVIPDYQAIGARMEMVEATREVYMMAAKQRAELAVDAVRQRAKSAGVDCNVKTLINDHPYRAIIDTAKDHHCDLIVMASHGRGGLSGILLGSETHKVVTHTNLPVLVYR